MYDSSQAQLYVHALCSNLYGHMSPFFKLFPYPVDRGEKRTQAALTAVNKTLPNTEVFHLNVFCRPHIIL